RGLARSPGTGDDRGGITKLRGLRHAEGQAGARLNVSPEISTGKLAASPVTAFCDRILADREVGAVGPAARAAGPARRAPPPAPPPLPPRLSRPPRLSPRPRPPQPPRPGRSEPRPRSRQRHTVTRAREARFASLKPPIESF